MTIRSINNFPRIYDVIEHVFYYTCNQGFLGVTNPRLFTGEGVRLILGAVIILLVKSVVFVNE